MKSRLKKASSFQNATDSASWGTNSDLNVIHVALAVRSRGGATTGLCTEKGKENWKVAPICCFLSNMAFISGNLASL